MIADAAARGERMGESIELQLPEQQGQDMPRFNTRRAAVRRWLRGLPVANPLETGREIYQQLAASNRQPIPPGRRLAFLGELHAYLGYSVEGLRTHYRDRELPLRGNPRKIATLSTRLLEEMALGHETALADARRGRVSSKRLAYLLVSAVHYRGLALVENWLVYENASPGSWQRLHNLYQIALDTGVTRRPIKAPWNGTRVTLATTYKRVALTAASAPLQLERGEVLDAWWLLGHWADAAEISALGDDGNEIFRLPRHDDRPPHPGISGLKRPDDRFLVTSPLIRRGDRDLGRRRWTWRRAPAAANYPGLARRLLIALAAVPARQSRRVRVSSGVRGVLGMSQSHQALSRELGLPVINSDTRERAFQNQDDSSYSNGRRNRDVWDRVHPSGVADAVERRIREHDKASRPQTDSKDEPTFDQWQLVNISPGGYCILTNPEQSYRARVGELIVLREGTGNGRPWQVGAVRWLRGIGGKGLQVGIQILGIDPHPVMLRARMNSGRYGPPERGFVLPGSNHKHPITTLITPGAYYHAHQTVTLRYGQLQGRITLGRCYEASQHLAQCEFDYADPLATDDELPQRLSGQPINAAS